MLGGEVVGKGAGQRLGAVLGDHEQVLDPDAAQRSDDRAGLDRDDVTRDQRLAAAPAEARRLVDLKPDAVAEAVVEALAQSLAGALGSRGRVARPGSFAS